MTVALLSRLKHPTAYDDYGHPLTCSERAASTVQSITASVKALPRGGKERFDGLSLIAYHSLAQSISAHYEREPRVTPRSAWEEKHVDLVADFFSTAHKACKGDSTIKKCGRSFNAFLLGIPSECFDEEINPGFEKFATRHYFAGRPHLAQELLKYRHTLQVGPNGEISIRMNGEYKAWADVKEVALADPSSALKEKFPHKWNPAWKYGHEGVQNLHGFEWTVAKPYKIVKNPPWGNRWVFEICCTCRGTFRPWGDHAWFRLKTPTGEIFSFGKYREIDTLAHGFEQQSAKRQSPDFSEFWLGIEDIHTLPVEISEKVFKAMIAKLEKEQAEDSLTFNVASHDNCTADTIQFAAMAGLKIDASLYFPYLFFVGRFPTVLEELVWEVREKMPTVANVVSKALFYPIFSLANHGQAYFGGREVSKTIPAAIREKVEPKFKTLADCYDPSKLEMSSVYLLLREMRKIEKSRQVLESMECLSPSSRGYTIPRKWQSA